MYTWRNSACVEECVGRMEVKEYLVKMLSESDFKCKFGQSPQYKTSDGKAIGERKFWRKE
jgi:hypothetical protein